MSEIKLLKDFPKNQWLEAADGCEYCKEKYNVMVTWVDETGAFGDIVKKLEHKEDCPERFDYETGVEQGQILLHDIAGWEFMDKPVKLFGKKFIPLKSRANVGPCLSCWKLVVGVPLILFIDKGRGGELDFCFTCAQKLGILDNLRGQ